MKTAAYMISYNRFILQILYIRNSKKKRKGLFTIDIKVPHLTAHLNEYINHRRGGSKHHLGGENSYSYRK